MFAKRIIGAKDCIIGSQYHLKSISRMNSIQCHFHFSQLAIWRAERSQSVGLRKQYFFAVGEGESRGLAGN